MRPYYTNDAIGPSLSPEEGVSHSSADSAHLPLCFAVSAETLPNARDVEVGRLPFSTYKVIILIACLTDHAAALVILSFPRGGKSQQASQQAKENATRTVR